MTVYCQSSVAGDASVSVVAQGVCTESLRRKHLGKTRMIRDRSCLFIQIQVCKIQDVSTIRWNAVKSVISTYGEIHGGIMDLVESMLTEVIPKNGTWERGTLC